MYFRYCPDCGKKNTHDDHFCGACGRDLTDHAPRKRYDSPSPAYTNPDPKPVTVKEISSPDPRLRDAQNEWEADSWEETIQDEAPVPVDEKEKQLQAYFSDAAKGDVDAQYELGLCYEFGDGVVKNDNTAFSWFCSAAQKGDARAQLKVGLCYQFGQGVRQSNAEAVRWFRKAAEQGDVDAQYNMGRCYELGAGVTPDWDEAAYWYKKAADQGDFLAREALINLQ